MRPLHVVHNINA